MAGRRRAIAASIGAFYQVDRVPSKPTVIQDTDIERIFADQERPAGQIDSRRLGEGEMRGIAVLDTQSGFQSRFEAPPVQRRLNQRADRPRLISGMQTQAPGTFQAG